MRSSRRSIWPPGTRRADPVPAGRSGWHNPQRRRAAGAVRRSRRPGQPRCAGRTAPAGPRARSGSGTWPGRSSGSVRHGRCAWRPSAPGSPPPRRPGLSARHGPGLTAQPAPHSRHRGDRTCPPGAGPGDLNDLPQRPGHPRLPCDGTGQRRSCRFPRCRPGRPPRTRPASPAASRRGRELLHPQ
jgi:hypothetical protein